MSEEKECPKCGEKMIYYPGRRSFGKTGKYICNCKDSGKKEINSRLTKAQFAQFNLR